MSVCVFAWWRFLVKFMARRGVQIWFWLNKDRSRMIHVFSDLPSSPAILTIYKSNLNSIFLLNVLSFVLFSVKFIRNLCSDFWIFRDFFFFVSTFAKMRNLFSINQFLFDTLSLIPVLFFIPLYGLSEIHV